MHENTHIFYFFFFFWKPFLPPLPPMAPPWSLEPTDQFQVCCKMLLCNAISHKDDKAVREPRVSPAFAITYFGNHCNISPTPMVIHVSKYVDTVIFFQKLKTKTSMTPRWPLTLLLLRSHVQGHLFFYYLPQTLGNNFSTLGKNSKFWGKNRRK